MGIEEGFLLSRMIKGIAGNRRWPDAVGKKEVLPVKSAEATNEDMNCFKGLLGRPPENNYKANYNSVGKFIDREDNVKLIWPSSSRKKGETEILKQENDTTAAQTAILIAEKGEPQGIVWERLDIVIDGGGRPYNPHPTVRMFSFEAVKRDVLEAALALNPEKYSKKSLAEIGEDLIEQKMELNKGKGKKR